MRKLPSLIGVIHLPPLAGSPGARAAVGAGNEASLAAQSLQRAGLQAVREAQLLAQAGFQGILIENFGDAPFYGDTVPPETVASLAIIAAAAREAVRLPIGINVLRNDARAALAIAAVSGCDFIRVNVLSGVAATDQGLIEGRAATLLRERDRLGAGGVAILADVLVKHARPLSGDDVRLAIEEAALRAGADGVILTGSTTGRPVDPRELEAASEACARGRIPLYVGSGATPESWAELKPFASGVIVGSALRKKGRAGAELDPKAARAFARAFLRKAKPKSKKKAPSRARKKRG